MSTTPTHAFWLYDQFPYTLFGVADLTREAWKTDCVYVPSYGASAIFKPFVLIAGTEGEELSDALKRLREERRNEATKMQLEFDQRLRELFAKHNIIHPRIGAEAKL